MTLFDPRSAIDAIKTAMEIVLITAIVAGALFGALAWRVNRLAMKRDLFDSRSERSRRAASAHSGAND
jgi:hypothetical protein